MANVDDARKRHSERFRKVSNRCPLTVIYAFGGDLARAMADDDAQVAATVAAWERAPGWEPRDWYAIGREEGRGLNDDAWPPALIEFFATS